MQFFVTACGRRIFTIAGLFAFVICCASQTQAAQVSQPQVGIAPGQTAAPTQTGTQAASQNGAPTLRVTAREVLVDVVVTDKAGQPVTGLKASDFAVTEQSAPQVIRRVDEHYPMSAADMNKLATAPALPPNTFSNYTPVRNTNAATVLLLDAMDSPLTAQMAMRDQLINYLKHMQPGPPIAIFQMDTEMRLIQGFTSDPKVLLAAAESKRDMPSMARPSAAPRTYTNDSVYRRTLSENLRSGMRMLGAYLSAYPGRKNLIWFTGRVPMTIMGMGFGYPFRDGLSVVGDTGDETTELTDVLTVSRVAVYPVDTLGLVAPGSAMNAGVPRIGAMRAGMMAPGSGVENHQNLDLVAEQTGGKAYYNTNDFTRVITDVINTGSSYYTIAYATTNTKWIGEFRHIKVTADQPDLHLMHKEGYYAYSLDAKEQSGIAKIEERREGAAMQQPGGESQGEQQVPAAPDAGSSADDPNAGATIRPTKGGFEAAMGLGAIPPTEIVFDAKVDPDASAEKLNKETPMPTDNYLMPEWQHKPFRNYTIAFNADAHKIRLTQTPDGVRHGKVQFVTLVYTGDGQQVNSITTTLELAVRQDTYRELLVSGLHFKQQIAIPVKGSFFLRLGVHDLTGDQVGALEIPVDQVHLAVAGAGTQAR